MKILVLHQYFLEEDGSGGTRFNEMTKIWQEKGHEITVIAGMMPDQNGKKRKEYSGKKFVLKKQENIEVLRCHVSENYNKNFFGRILGYISFSLSSFWGGYFRLKKNYDVVLVTSPPLFIGISGYFLAKKNKAKFIFEIRDLWPESAVDTGVIKNKFIIDVSYKIEKWLYKKADLINVLTPAFRENLIEKKNVDASKIVYVSNAADFALSEKFLIKNESQKIREKYNAQNKFIIVYVGAHGLANGLNQILYTAELLKDTNVEFWLIGKGMKRNDLILDAKERKINNVVFIEPVPKNEIFNYILAADMGTSVLMKNDTFKTVYSNKTFDYLSCKKPLFLAIDGVSRKLVEEADAGIFVEPENPEDFAKKIRFYIDKPDLIIKQGEKGYKYIKDNFDRNELAAKYIKYIEDIVGQ